MKIIIKTDFNFSIFFIISDFIYNFKPDVILHLAAESHVDRSIDKNYPFIKSNILGTHSILESVRFYFSNLEKRKKPFGNRIPNAKYQGRQ